MADVIIKFKIMPTGVDVDLSKLEDAIKEAINPQRIEREPIAFGLIALNVTKLVNDSEGELEKFENKLTSLEGVGQVEIIEITRTL